MTLPSLRPEQVVQIWYHFAQVDPIERVVAEMTVSRSTVAAYYDALRLVLCGRESGAVCPFWCFPLVLCHVWSSVANILTISHNR